MSEYQYYEFLALDRPLTDKQRAELRVLAAGEAERWLRLVTGFGRS